MIMMCFGRAIDAVKYGLSVRRQDWYFDDKYIKMVKKNDKKTIMMFHKDGDEKYHPTDDDMLADDWEVM